MFRKFRFLDFVLDPFDSSSLNLFYGIWMILCIFKLCEVAPVAPERISLQVQGSRSSSRTKKPNLCGFYRSDDQKFAAAGCWDVKPTTFDSILKLDEAIKK